MNFKIKVTKKNTGETTSCYFAKAKLENGKCINLTYDCMTGKLVVHEWYVLASDSIESFTSEVKDYFKQLIRKQTFFDAQVAMDKFIIAQHMNLSDEAMDRLDRERQMLLKEILAAGLIDEFKKYIHIA